MHTPDGSSKTCTKCGLSKPLADFSTDKRARDGRASHCRSCCAEYARAIRRTNPEIDRERKRKYRAANRDKVLAREKRYRAANFERRYQAARAWRLANPKKHNGYAIAHAKRNPDWARERCARHRALKANAPESEKIDRAAIWARDGGRCHLCGKPCNPAGWHLDHLVPLSRGGSHIMSNVAVSHPSCNTSRGNRGPAQLRLPDR